jgi:hypothetical protein
MSYPDASENKSKIGFTWHCPYCHQKNTAFLNRWQDMNIIRLCVCGKKHRAYLDENWHKILTEKIDT